VPVAWTQAWLAGAAEVPGARTGAAATARDEAGVVPIEIVVSAIAAIATEVHSVVRRRRRSVPILILDQAQTNEIPKRRHLNVDDLLRPQEQRRATIVRLLRLGHDHDKLIRDEVTVDTPSCHEELTLVVRVLDRLQVGDHDVGARRTEDGLCDVSRPGPFRLAGSQPTSSVFLSHQFSISSSHQPANSIFLS
jgi:hypothetical protein